MRVVRAGDEGAVARGRPAQARAGLSLARDLAIDLGTANTLVYERGARHRPQRAVGDRAQQPHRRRARHGPRGVADDRPHARLHRRGAPAAQGRHHRLRDHAAHDPAAAAAGRRQPVQPAAGRDLRAVGHHRGRAARRDRGGPARPARPRRSSSSSRWPRRSAPGSRSTSRSATWSSTSAAAPRRPRSSRSAASSRSQAVRVGSFDIDAAMQTYIRREYGIAIGERTAEEIKVAIGSAWPTHDEFKAEVRGRDLMSGLPKTVILSPEEVREAIDEPVVGHGRLGDRVPRPGAARAGAGPHRARHVPRRRRRHAARARPAHRRGDRDPGAPRRRAARVRRARRRPACIETYDRLKVMFMGARR